jgi:hypothetical protein
MIFNEIDNTRGKSSSHRCWYISIPKYWQAKTRIKANTMPRAAQPTAK